MKIVKMVVGICIVGLGTALLASAMTWDGLAALLMPRGVEADPEGEIPFAEMPVFKPSLQGPSGRHSIKVVRKMPIFKPPLQSIPRRRIGAGTRGPADTAHSVFALVPHKDVGLTLQAQPTLYWFLSQETTTYLLEVSVLQGKGIKSSIVKEWRLNPPLQAGVYPIRLTEHDIHLTPGVLYQWSVALIRDPDDRSQDIVSGGFMQRIDPNDLPAASREALKQLPVASATDTPHIYVRAGIWYDAVSTLSELITASPQETELRELRASLLEQPAVQLPDVAAYDRQHK